MIHITKTIDGKLMFECKVVSLVDVTEHYWYTQVYTSGFPSMRSINEKVHLDSYFSFEKDTIRGKMVVEIKKLED